MYVLVELFVSCARMDHSTPRRGLARAQPLAASIHGIANCPAGCPCPIHRCCNCRLSSCACCSAITPYEGDEARLFHSAVAAVALAPEQRDAMLRARERWLLAWER